VTVRQRDAKQRVLRHHEEACLAGDGEAIYRTLFHAAAVGIALVDRDRSIIEANAHFAELLGYRAEELRGRTAEELTHADDRAASRAASEALLAGEVGEVSLEKRFVRRDLTTVWCRATATALRAADGTVRQMVAVIEEIGARRTSEEVRNRLAAVVESSDDAIISKTLDGIVTSWNQAAERIFGYTAAEIIGKSVPLLIPPDHLDEEPTILERLKRGERIDHYETVRMHKDGTRLHVSLTVSPIRDGDGRIVGASKISRDITLQKHIEHEIAEYAGALERLNATLRENDRRKDEF